MKKIINNFWEKFKNINKLFFPGIQLTDSQIKVQTIINILCKHNNTEFHLSPISNKVYLINRELSYYIIISDNIISIDNHSLFVTYEFLPWFTYKIVKTIYITIEEKGKKIETEILYNKEKALDKILQQL
jgi:hypothetical protein